jgi:hypothetical protein
MPIITKPNQHFDVLTWTGDNSSTGTTKNRTGLGFQPDFVWIKNRGQNYFHNLYDAVRGAGSTKNLISNGTNIEGDSNYAGQYGYVSAFNSDGFQTINGTDATDPGIWVNQNGQTFVAWNWKAGGTAVTNTSGTISSQVSANPTAGFSVVAWTGNGSASATVGHGLGAVPAMIICKERTGTDYWHIKHKSLATTVNAYFNTNALYTAAQVGDGMIGDLSSSTTFGFVTAGSPGNVVAVNENGVTNIAYCWSEVPGYSAFGSYTGNGSTNGPFIYTGFRPRFLMVKRTDNTTNDWAFFDSEREPNNVMIKGLKPNKSEAEYSGYNYRDFLSNGFKWRNGDSDINENGGTYIYAAFAEAPFKYANAK